MEAFNDCFEETVDFVWTGDLEEGAEDLRGAEGGGGRWERGCVEVVEHGLEG